MSLTLTSTITATALSLRVTGTVPADLEAPYQFRLDDEVLLLRSFGRPWDGGRQKWLVKRHQEGTAASSHTSGATVKAVTSALVAGDDEDLPDPFASGGGGGVTVTGSQGGSVAGATEFRAAGTVADLGDGVAGQGLVVQQIGPYTVDFDDTNVNSDVIVLGDALPDGAVVLAAWATFPIEWKSDTNAGPDFKIEVASYPTPYFNFVLKEYATPTGSFTTTEVIPIASGTHTHTIPAGTDAGGGTTGARSAPIPSEIGIVDYAAWSDAAGDTVAAIKLAVEVYVNGGDHFTQGQAKVYAIVATPAS